MIIPDCGSPSSTDSRLPTSVGARRAPLRRPREIAPTPNGGPVFQRQVDERWPAPPHLVQPFTARRRLVVDFVTGAHFRKLLLNPVKVRFNRRMSPFSG